MHRFGRSAQQKMKDRWGGGFILATILALVGAFYVGTWLNNAYNKSSTANPDNSGSYVNLPDGSGTGIASVPENFDLHLVQVGAFRSKDSAQKLVNSLAAKNYNAMMADRNTQGLYRVYGGLFTDAQAASNAKTMLATETGVTNPWVVKVPVASQIEAIPVTATQGSKAADLKKGMENMVAYLYEAARWMENGSVDPATLAARGKDLSKLATEMSKMNNASLTPYAQFAQNAGANAAVIETAAKASMGSSEYHQAMTGYLSLVDEYRALASTAPAGNN